MLDRVVGVEVIDGQLRTDRVTLITFDSCRAGAGVTYIDTGAVCTQGGRRLCRRKERILWESTR